MLGKATTTGLPRRWVARDEQGFTMMEMILVLAIVVILLAIGFVALVQWRASMEQMELDSTAKEVFIAAQNQLATAESQGMLENVAENKRLNWGGADGDERYFVFGPEYAGTTSLQQDTAGDDPDNLTSALHLMLPFGSIIEDVRKSGTYVVCYQPESGKILGVFYRKVSDENDQGFTTSLYTSTLKELRGDSPAQQEARRNVGGKMVGYYGGGDTADVPDKLSAPTVSVTNGDMLSVKVTAKEGDLVKLFVEGEESQAQIWYTLTASGVNAGTGEYTKVLDSTVPSGSISNQFADTVVGIHPNKKYKDNKLPAAGGQDFIPGENLIIYATATYSDRYATIARSATVTTNSLFASAKETDDTEGNGKHLAVGITSFRHLTNLDGEASGFEPELLTETVFGTSPAVSAYQLGDLSWSSYAQAIGYLNQAGDPKPMAPIKVHQGGAAFGSSYTLAYSGGGATRSHALTGCAIRSNGAAGLFDVVPADMSVSNLVLIDFDVLSEGGPAGSLAGSLTNGCAITNVLARESLSNNESRQDTKSISASGAAGGLAGEISGTAPASGGTHLSDCAASLYVKSSGGAAGGLVGSTASGTVIERCYSGGHTAVAESKSLTEGSAAGYLQVHDAAAGSKAGRVNVVSDTGAAGGLVGATTGTSISSCYSTCSVYGTTFAGGLIGDGSGGSVSSCYSTGWVGCAENGVVGAFAGDAGDSMYLSGNCYYSTVNDKMVPVGSEPEIGVSDDGEWLLLADADEAERRKSVLAFDVNNATFREFAAGTGSAIPYDPKLAEYYSGNYVFKTLAELGQLDSTQISLLPADSHIKIHYGDWATPDITAVNS